MKLGAGAFLTDCGLGICDLARQIEDAGLESLFLVQNSGEDMRPFPRLEPDPLASETTTRPPRRGRLADPTASLFRRGTLRPSRW